MSETKSPGLEQKLKTVTPDNLPEAVTALQKLDPSEMTKVIATLRIMQGNAKKPEDWNAAVHGRLLNAAIEIQNSKSSFVDKRLLGKSLPVLQQMERDLGRSQSTGEKWTPSIDGPLLDAVTQRIKLLGRDLPESA